MEVLAIAIRGSTMDYERAMAVSTQARVVATMALDADRRPREEKMAIQWRRGAKSASAEHDSSRVHSEFRTLYLHLPYSRDIGWLRRSATNVQAAAIQGTTMIYEERPRTVEGKLHDKMRRHYYEWGERSGQARTLRFKLHRQSSRIRHLTSIDMEPNGSGFYSCFVAFYLRVHYSRVDDVIEERTCQYTVRQLRQLQDIRREAFEEVAQTCTRGWLKMAAQQWISESLREAQDARSIETRPSGLDGPREYKFLQSIDDSSSYDTPAVQGHFMGRRTVEWLVRGDTVSVLDIVQRHHEVPFYPGDIEAEEWDMLDILNKSGIIYIVRNTSLRQGAKDPSVYAKANVEATRTIIDAAIAAGVRRLVYTSSADVVFIGTDVVNVDERVPYLEKLFDTYNLLPYRSTTSSEPRLDPEGATAKPNESLHRALPPICATTEYHRTMQTLSSYVAPTPNAESILSAFNTPFDPCGLTDPIVRSRSDGQVFFITSGEAFGILDFTRVYNEYERKPSHLKVQGTYEWLCDEMRVWLVIEWWSFEATASFRWRRCIEDSCAELNGSIFLFCFVSYRLQLLYYRKVQCLRRGRSDIQVAAVWKCKATHKDEHRTIKSKLHKTIRQLYYDVEGKEMFDGEDREAAWWILATTTGLDVDRPPHKIGSVVRWRRSMMGADPELNSSNFRFEFRMPYLHPCYSRGNGYLRRMAVMIQESTMDFEQRTHRHTVKQAQRMLLELQRRSSVAEGVAQHARDIGTIPDEPGGSMFRFSSIKFYLWLRYSRLSEGLRSRGKDRLPSRRGCAQCVQSDLGSRTEPGRSFLSFVFMMFYSRIYRSKVLNKVKAQLLISEGKEDGASSWVECEELLMKLRKGKFEAKVPFSVLIRTLSTARYRYPGAKEKHQDFVHPTVRLKADDQDRTKLAPSPVGVEDLSSKRA
ncbi:hypothetical protein BKA82DRAFT_20166 [Pisolithus tinctorius]|uniref:3-beta hydroxysteroid dehydrogenase/isomerase domain-containing protein n=1 Tax=Pisolithus tinctorius Marx 270 TaxID=870435 RepID=A0A0C3JQN2_PISTI|nr:hypothetical protein BKA82DRAFT_20166 [Pisolithus tinctorius]KIO11483.1 hypothetical protein M404DRAFT_20166 [Pisolithus tinctorius Marx 270]